MFASPEMMMFFFFNDTATTEIYTLPLHDALPICIVKKNAIMMIDFALDAERAGAAPADAIYKGCLLRFRPIMMTTIDRKSTRLNSSHGYISYAVFCLKKKKQQVPISDPLLHNFIH